MLVNILILRVSAHVLEKLQNSAALDIIDWARRGKVVVMLTPYVQGLAEKKFCKLRSYKP